MGQKAPEVMISSTDQRYFYPETPINSGRRGTINKMNLENVDLEDIG